MAYKSLHGAVKSVPVVAAELRVGTLKGGVTEGLGLLEAVTVGLLVLVVLGAVEAGQ